MQGIIINIDKEELENIISKAIETALLKSQFSRDQAEDRGAEILIMKCPDVCKYLNMKMSTLYQLTHKKEIPFNKKSKTLYFIKDEIDQWLADGKQLTRREQNFAREFRIALSDTKRTKTIA